MNYELRSLLASIRGVVPRVRRCFQYYRDRVYVAPGSFVHPSTVIGRGTRINAPSHLGECEIGCFCAIGGRLVVRSTDHHTNYLNMQTHLQTVVLGSSVDVGGKSKGPVRIGNGVWIGDSVIVLPGVEIGNGAVVGAGSVVAKSIPDYAVAVGSPARVIRFRFAPDVIEALSGLEWWTWDSKTLRARRELFEVDFTRMTGDDVRRLRSKYGLLA